MLLIHRVHYTIQTKLSCAKRFSVCTLSGAGAKPNVFNRYCARREAPTRACALVPQVVQTCQACQPWRRPGQSNKFTFSLALPFQEEVQFDLLSHHSAFELGLGGEKGIPIVHLIDCCIRWSACMMSSSRSARDLLHCIPAAWVNVLDGMHVLIVDGEAGVRFKEVDDWAMCSQIALRYKAPHEQARLGERHNASLRSARQRAGSQAIKKSLCIGFITVLGSVAFVHGVLVRINEHAAYQAFLGRQPHLPHPLEGGCHGDLDVKGQHH